MDQSVTHLLCTDEQYKARKKIKRNLYRVFADVCPFEYQVELFRIFTDNFGTCEEKYVLYTGGKPVGKGLTRGKTLEECLELNRRLRQMHHDLFGDTQINSDDNPSTMEGPKTQDPAQECEHNSNHNTSDATYVGITNQDAAEQELLELLKDKGIEEATHSPFSPVENFRSLSMPTFDEVAAGTDAAQAQLIQESIDQAAKDARGEEGQSVSEIVNKNAGVDPEGHASGRKRAASDKSKAIDVLLKAANASQGVRDILSKTDFARIIGELDDLPIEQVKARDFSQDQEPVKSHTIVEPDFLEIPTDEVEENPLSRVKLQPCDRARIREAFEHMTWSQKRKRDTDKEMAAFRTPESAGTFMGAGEVRVVTKRVKKAAKHKSEARHITKAMRETAGAEITQEGTLRPLSEEQVAHIFSQPIPQPGGKIPSSKAISMGLSLDDVSGMVDEMFGVSKFDDGTDLMTEMHGERPWPAGHDPASPEDDPAHTNEPVEDFDTRAPSFAVMSARTAARGSSGIEVHCFMDRKAGEHRSGISMALSNNESSAEDDYVLSQGPNTAMQTHISPADEASSLHQYWQSAPRTEACFAPFAEEESMFQSSNLYPDVSAHFKPKTN
ncbi:uncharacterized protein VDAG_05739 [Verticillium dahliae VdLs.17]|uniref:Uncharacterized protein n=1 Tax=Verticillium dahliae (strain VdLs.17 / ATCC MYA-4575 / FGSC 10137) TaxID=498257 RepID=G2X6F7_VERDV|nr:uncharacterized protein VDAG_05739 [Verticillium dahliae VdLs.17]EGY14575.1 hypothetical protein VDAG_05739 [Verticillium dahliae VdLs.17]